jgi:transposase-like protein
MNKQVIKRYSLAFKHQVVREYEAGAGFLELRDKYGIGGGSTIRNWVGQYGRKGTRQRMIIIQSPEEQEHVKELKQRISQLEKAVAQLTLDKLMLETTLAVAEEEMGVPVKKNGAQPSFNGRTSIVVRPGAV